MNRLLVMACSATKSSHALPLPAVDRYTGPIWGTWRAVDPAQHLAHVTVLSAEHGWIDGREPIVNYNRKLDNVRGRELIQRGVTVETVAMLSEASGYGSRQFTEVCIVGGHYYQAVARELVDLANSAMLPELFTPGFRIVEICDQIGFMRQKLRAWLVAGAQQVAA
jgi:hypothetical protein